MAQLIKLQDYISRYEQNIFVYSSRFVTLKKKNWKRFYFSRKKAGFAQASGLDFDFSESREKSKVSLFRKMANFCRRKRGGTEPASPAHFPPGHEETSRSVFNRNRPVQDDELKRRFLDEIFPLQLKWASATLTEMSFVDNRFYRDPLLKYFLQRFPDNFFVLYKPVFMVKTAPVETESILITPTDVWCLSFLEYEDNAVYFCTADRFWLKKVGRREENVLNPLPALNRTEKIVKNILEKHASDLSIHKVVLSRNGYFDILFAPPGTRFIDKKQYESWFQTMRAHSSPVKHAQLAAARALLEHCRTQAVPRPEWRY